MSAARIVFPGPQGILVLRADGRLVLLPARAAAGSRGRRGRPRLLPELPGSAHAVGFDGRWIEVQSWRDGEALLVRVPPRSDEVEVESLGEAAEPQVAGLSVLPDPSVLWPVPSTEPSSTECLRLGGTEPMLALPTPEGPWLVCSRRGEVAVEDPRLGRVVSPARLGRCLGLASLVERELSFVGADGTLRRTVLELEAEETAACWGAPWLAVLASGSVSLRELGPRWGRRIGRWALPSS